MQLEFQILYVKELARLLGVTDPRTVKRWCRLNGVAILKDSGRRASYIIRSDYEVAQAREFISHLKKRHGKHWLAAYKAHVNFDIELLSGLQDVSRVDRYAESTMIPINKTRIGISKFRQQALQIINSTAEK